MISTADRISGQLSQPGLELARDVGAVATATAKLTESITAELSESKIDPGERRRLRALLHGLATASLPLLVWARRFEQGILPR
jgi:hypothetical protein